MSNSSPNQAENLSKRAEPEEIEERHTRFLKDDDIRSILDAIPEAVLILNEFRQIVFVNKASLDTFNISSREFVCGLRPGEAFLCNHSDETPDGCGTSDFCKYCGANISILASYTDKSLVKECRITQKDGSALELKVKAGPFYVNQARYTVFSLLDISDEKRREVLQRLFFHDILNTAGGLSGYSELLIDAGEKEIEEYKQIIRTLSLQIVDQITGQRVLTEAETGTLELNWIEVTSLQLLEEVTLACKAMQHAQDKRIIVDQSSDNIQFRTDMSLITRILANLIKNALEASEAGETVTTGCKKKDRMVEFFVNNPTAMPESTRHQVFQRSFSTKGKGRGLGTYSVKLFTETFLGGSVHFTSDDENGTSFFVSFPCH